MFGGLQRRKVKIMTKRGIFSREVNIDNKPSLQDSKTDFQSQQKKPRYGSSYTFENLVLLLGCLITWLWENKDIFPEFYYMYMLGDKHGWNITMKLTNIPSLLDYSLESCHKTTTQLIPKSREPQKWKELLSLQRFKWFKYLYLNRHSIPPQLAKKPFYNILPKFRAKPISTTLNMIEKVNKTKKFQKKIKEYVMQERTENELIRFENKIIKAKDLVVSSKMNIDGFSFIEPPTTIQHIEDGESFCIRDVENPELIIGGRIANAVPKAIMPLLKKLLLQVLRVQCEIPRSELRKALCSRMCAYGATKNSAKGSAGEINFFVSKDSSRCKLPNEEDREKINTIMHTDGFTLIQELIILVYLDCYPEGILHFLEMSSTWEGSPYLPSDLTNEKELKYGPLMWSLYVTMNYMNKIHIDRCDRSEFTLAVVSNTNQSNRGGEFHFLSHGISFRQCDRDLFYFRGKKLHGTAYREIPDEHVLVAALVINPSVANIVKKKFSP